MLPLLLLLASASSSLASPLPDPAPFAVYLPPVASSSNLPTSEVLPRSPAPPISVSLAHSPTYIARQKAADKAKRHVLAIEQSRRDGSGVRSFMMDERDTVDPTWLLREEAKIDGRYNSGLGAFGVLLAKELGGSKKRQNGEVKLADHNLDTSYSASVSIGTPAQTFNIILDTGSADLWVASSECGASCSSFTSYDQDASTTSKASTTAFSITYGSGATSGLLVQDTVTLGGYSVAAQTFASCDTISSGLIRNPVSGIMGLSWQSLAYSKAVPWWMTLAKSSSWSEPLFAFYLARWRDVSGAQTTEAEGGTATFGFLDTALYSGDITYVTVPDSAEYWQIPMDSITIQGTSISLGSSNAVAVDTGTTLIGGPESIITAIYAAIPGSSRMTGSYANYFQYPCTTSIDMTITFGGFAIDISDRDFNLGRYSSDQTLCTGAVFVQALSDSSPVQWIVGDTALKNSYTVFRYDPPAVGFASLASEVTSSAAAGHSTAIPSATLDPIASTTLSVASSSISNSSSSASSISGSASSSAQSTSTEAPYVVTQTVVEGSAASSAGVTGADAAQAGASSGAATSLVLGGGLGGVFGESWRMAGLVGLGVLVGVWSV